MNSGPPLSPWQESVPSAPAATISFGKYDRGPQTLCALASETTGTDTSRMRSEVLPPSLVVRQPATVRFLRASSTEREGPAPARPSPTYRALVP